MVEIKEIESRQFERLLGLMTILRTHCPWDKKQTFESLIHLTIEEVYELMDAIEANDTDGIGEEIGDLMLHVVFYAKILEEQNGRSIDELLHKLIEKLIFRHPHIFENSKAISEEEIKQNWEKLKLKEGRKSVLGGVPKSLPSIVKAYRIQEKAAQVGFDWLEIDMVKEKLNEELAEMDVAIASGEKSKIEDEIGDVFFSLVNLSRKLGIDPEMAIQRTNQKFKNRFEYIEKNSNKPLSEMKLDEMEKLWIEAKTF